MEENALIKRLGCSPFMTFYNKNYNYVTCFCKPWSWWPKTDRMVHLLFMMWLIMLDIISNSHWIKRSFIFSNWIFQTITFSYDVPSQMTFMRVLLESKWLHWTGTDTIISAYPKPNHGTVEHDDNMVWWSVGICAIVSHNLCELSSSISTGDWSHSEVRLENHSQPFLHAWLFHALASKNIEDAQVRCGYDAFQLHCTLCPGWTLA